MTTFNTSYDFYEYDFSVTPTGDSRKLLRDVPICDVWCRLNFILAIGIFVFYFYFFRYLFWFVREVFRPPPNVVVGYHRARRHVYDEQSGKIDLKNRSSKARPPKSYTTPKHLEHKMKLKQRDLKIKQQRDKRIPGYVDIPMEEQSGLNIRHFDKYIREITLLETLRRVIMSVQDKSGMVSALVMYAQAHSSKSLLDHVLSLSRYTSRSDDIEGFVNILCEQSGENECVWIEQLRACFTNWQQYKHSKVSKSFLNLVNYVVSVGLCEKASLTFSLGNVNLFAPVVTKRQLCATDLCELVIETALGFIEGGWRVYCNKSISAFFFEEDLFTEFEKTYNDIRDIHGYSLTGNLKRYADISENDYELKLDSAIALAEKLVSKIGKTMTFDRKFVTDRLDKIRDFRTEFVQIRTRGGLRVAPFGVSLYGDSAVGKSTLNQLTYEAIGKFNDIAVTPDRVATWADNDKFASNIRASTNVIIFDDFGNTSPKFMDFSPCYRLIQCVNNALFTAPMAEVNLKGKVGLHPWIVTLTTNVEYLLANVYSEKPEAILRRFYHVKVNVKKEFLKDGKLDEDAVYNQFGHIKLPDVWELSVRSCVVGDLIADGSTTRRYSLEPVVFEGKKLVGLSVHEYLRWVQLASRDHYARQRSLVETMRRDSSHLCTTCGFYGCKCNIPVDWTAIPLETEDELEEHAGLARTTLQAMYLILNLMLKYLVGGTLSMFYFYTREWYENYFYDAPTPSPFFPRYYRFVDQTLRTWYHYASFSIELLRLVYTHYATNTLLGLQDFYENHWLFDAIVYLPDNYVYSNFFIFATMYQRRTDIIMRKRILIVAVLCVYYLSLFHLYHSNFMRALVTFIFANISVGTAVAAERMQIEQELLRRRSVVPATVAWMRNHYIVTGMGVLSGIYSLLRLYRASVKLQTQGSLLPKTMEDIRERDAEVNPWAEFEVAPLPMTVASKTTVCEDLIAISLRNTVVVESSRYVVRGFFLTSNALVVPYHYLRIHRENGFKGDIAVKCYRTARNKVGGNFREVLSEDYSYRIPGTDFIVFYSPSSGSVANVIKFLPTDKPTTTDARFVLKNVDEDNVISPILFEAQRVEHTSMSFDGGRYILPYDSFAGMCMSPIVSKGHGASIIGFHLCGKNRTGGAGYISKAQAESAILYLNSLDGCIIAPAARELPKEQYGFQVLQDTDVHKKSAARHITPGNSLEVYGTIAGMITPTSKVVDTLISPHVTGVTGIPQQWGPPKMSGHGVYPYQAALEVLAHPSLSLGSYIRPAVICYRSVFPEIKKRLPELFSTARPLSEVETVSGIDGVRFIDAMNMKTSPGWPFSGRKDKWIVELNPEVYPGISRPRTFVPMIWDEVYRCCNIFLQGERPYFIWKACLKDEPTKLTKTKVRVFQSAPIALQLLIRMYFLPIVRIIQCNPLESECLVGVNAEGPEWEQLNDFMISKGPNILAGDYSKYDQRMPAQLVIAAFDVLIWIAQELCFYPVEAIMIMRGIVGEVAFPLMSYNGDLLQLFGSNPSGQNLTVIINSIGNVILMRSCYYHIYPQDAEHNLFRKYCAMGSYGDDVKGSVSVARSGFNHISYAQFLHEFDIVFTMPDKESVATRYMDADDADFLKRSNRYHEDLQINVGVLSEVSIFKRLHSHLLSSELSLEMQSATNIDSSLHDWFYYGRDMFEFRRKQMLAVATRAGIAHLCRGFDFTYDQRVLRWNQKYRGVSNNPDISSLSDTSILDLGYETEIAGSIGDSFYVCDNITEFGRLVENPTP